MSNALVIIPTYIREPRDLQVTLETIESVRATEPHVPLIIVDDCSPAEGLYDELRSHGSRLEFEAVRKSANTGFSATVNRGLRVALQEGRDAVLLNADITCTTPGWAALLEEQEDSQGRPAAVVGALLSYPNGLIQHAGVFFSLLTRSFDHRYRFGPENLPEAHRTTVCPVTGAFQYIRHSTLATIGIYDEDYQMSYEDVDYCLRVFNAGMECIYTSKVRAVHHESLFRGRADEKLQGWQNESLRTLMMKHGRTNNGRFVPELV